MTTNGNGRSDIPALFSGLGAAASAVPASLLISLAGILFVLGYDGLAFGLGWLGGLVLGALLIGPTLRRSGAPTVAEFIGARYGSPARHLAVVVVVVVAFMLLVAELSLSGFLLSRFLGVGLVWTTGLVAAVVALSVAAGGMSLTRTHWLNYVVLAAAYLGTIACFSIAKHGLPLPQLTYGEAVAEVTRLEMTLLERGLADLRTFQPHAKPFLQLDRLNFFALTLCLMAGAAALPHVLGRYVTAPSVREARLTGAWSVLFVLALLITAPAYAAYAKLEVYSLIAKETRLTALPSWLEALSRTDLVRIHGVSLKLVEDVTTATQNGSGDVSAVATYLDSRGLDTAPAWAGLKAPVKTAILDIAKSGADPHAPAAWEAFQRSVLPAAALASGNKTGLLTQGALAWEPFAIMAAVPGMLGAGWALAALLGAGAAAAVLATATSLAVTIASTLAQAHSGTRDGSEQNTRLLLVSRLAVVLAAALAAVIAVAAPPDTIAAVLAALSIAAAALFPVLVLGIWWRRANSWGALAGMTAGLAVCLYYMIGTRCLPVDFYEAWPHLSNASDAAVRKFASLKTAWANAAEGEAKRAAWALLEAHARGVGAKVGVANWFGVHAGAAALFALPAAFVAAVVVSLATPRPGGELTGFIDKLRTPDGASGTRQPAPNT